MEKRNPFTVPEGYFDDFNARLMARLPERKVRRPWYARTMVWRYAALVAVVLGAAITLVVAQQPKQNDYTAEALDYAMISNTDIELYLCDAQ